MTYDLTGWFHAQRREQRRAWAETMRCPVCHDIHAYEGDCPDFMAADREYERSQDR